MARRLRGIGPVRSGCVLTLAVLTLAVLALLAAAPAQAQYATACPAPKKLAAGACVTACPAGYEDQGRVCVYRNMSR
ncbi:hypothetical protein [Methylobacterium sp. PvR107]|uniref:hypothetical protein n=1 Tax=Methylobacterium sp. PvR107 TaxID=2806597 RepID=UPI001AE5B590|nr:hypothetical protein [Methylobacterium sp. PvR107]MBP1181244.1 hypothetical protein [Methylobacterium sp. PvR107]